MTVVIPDSILSSSEEEQAKYLIDTALEKAEQEADAFSAFSISTLSPGFFSYEECIWLNQYLYGEIRIHCFTDQASEVTLAMF